MKNAIALATSFVVGLQLAACDLRQPPILGQSPSPTLPPGRVVLQADLTGEQEVPPTTSSGTGTATAILNTNTEELSWSVNYHGLSAVSAHIHGPADPGANSVAQIDIGKSALKSPIRGSAKVTAQEAEQILDGKWYVNIHTARNPGGEIRGQLTPLTP
jgi:hypothetical protein